MNDQCRLGSVPLRTLIFALACATAFSTLGCEKRVPPASTASSSQDASSTTSQSEARTAMTTQEPLDGPAIVRRHVLAAGGGTVPPEGASRTLTFNVHFKVPGAAERRVEEPMGTVVVRRRAPNLLRTETTIPGVGEMQGGYDGSVGWALDGANARARLLEGQSVEEIRREAVLDREIHLDLVYPSAELLGEIVREDVDCWNVRLGDEDGTLAHAFFSKETGLLFELARQLPSPSGPMGVLQRFTDWVDYGHGRLYPRYTETRLGPSTQITELLSVGVVPLDVELFALPAAVRALLEQKTED